MSHYLGYAEIWVYEVHLKILKKLWRKHYIWKYWTNLCLCIHHCACWWPGTIRCRAISRPSDYQVGVFLMHITGTYRVNLFINNQTTWLWLVRFFSLQNKQWAPLWKSSVSKHDSLAFTKVLIRLMYLPDRESIDLHISYGVITAGCA